MSNTSTVGHGDFCPEGFYCLAGDDCNSNSTLCEIGVCQVTVPSKKSCNQGIKLLAVSQLALDKQVLMFYHLKTRRCVCSVNTVHIYVSNY